MPPRDARRAALDILYQADITDSEPAAVLDQWGEAGRDVSAVHRRARGGGVEPRARIDMLLGEHARGWPWRGWRPVDRTILRVATYELLSRRRRPTAVAISEAVEAANELSTEDAGGS